MKNKVESVKEIRAKLGLSLSEAHDFYMQEPSSYSERLNAQLEHQKNTSTVYESMEEKIRAVIREYYSALDQHKHAGIAQDQAFTKIQDLLGMVWNPGN